MTYDTSDDNGLTLEQKLMIANLQKAMPKMRREDLEEALLKAYSNAFAAQNLSRQLLKEKIRLDI